MNKGAYEPQFSQDGRLIYEESKINVEEYGSFGPDSGSRYPNSKVIITNKHISISQKMVFRDKYIIHFVIYPDKTTKEVEFYSLRTGVRSFKIKKEDVELIFNNSKADSKPIIEIKPKECSIKTIKIFSDNSEQMLHHMKKIL